MSFVDLKKLVRSFKYASRGFWYSFRHEQNIRLHLFASLIVIILMVYFQVDLWQAIILFIVITMVLVLELINTIFERMTDMLRPRIHYYAEVIKDIMAAAVLVASIGAVIIGVLIFGPYIFS